MSKDIRLAVKQFTHGQVSSADKPFPGRCFHWSFCGHPLHSEHLILKFTLILVINQTKVMMTVWILLYILHFKCPSRSVHIEQEWKRKENFFGRSGEQSDWPERPVWFRKYVWGRPIRTLATREHITLCLIHSFVQLFKNLCQANKLTAYV